PPSPRTCSPLFPYTTLFRSSLSFDYTAGRIPNAIPIIACGRDTWRGAPRLARGILVASCRLGWSHWGGVINVAPAAGWKSLIERSEEHTSELQSRFDLVCRL